MEANHRPKFPSYKHLDDPCNWQLTWDKSEKEDTLHEKQWLLIGNEKLQKKQKKRKIKKEKRERERECNMGFSSYAAISHSLHQHMDL